MGSLDFFSRQVRFSDSINCFLGIWLVHSETHWLDSWRSSDYCVSCPCTRKSACHRAFERKTTDFSRRSFQALSQQEWYEMRLNGCAMPIQAGGNSQTCALLPVSPLLSPPPLTGSVCCPVLKDLLSYVWFGDRDVWALPWAWVWLDKRPIHSFIYTFII